MLSPDNRLRRRVDFTAVVRRGRRAARPLLTVHLLPAAGADGCVRAGLVVSKAVGGSVVRSQVARRLRHQLRDVLPSTTWLPAGTHLVIRAQPAAATATSSALGADLGAALNRLAPRTAPS